jgi:hypothetical protein
MTGEVAGPSCEAAGTKRADEIVGTDFIIDKWGNLAKQGTIMIIPADLRQYRRGWERLRQH